jgi:DNA-binding XRE family transcriptional regulator
VPHDSQGASLKLAGGDVPKTVGGEFDPPMFYLAERRAELRLTQKQLADKLGTTEMTISRWERGDIQMNMKTFAKVAYALGTKPEDLFRPQAPPI